MDFPKDMPLISVIASLSGELWLSHVAWMLILRVPAGLKGTRKLAIKTAVLNF